MRTQLRYTSCVPDGKGVYAPGHLDGNEVDRADFNCIANAATEDSEINGDNPSRPMGPIGPPGLE
jgi:hypothetical protein